MCHFLSFFSIVVNERMHTKKILMIKVKVFFLIIFGLLFAFNNSLILQLILIMTIVSGSEITLNNYLTVHKSSHPNRSYAKKGIQKCSIRKSTTPKGMKK